MGIVTDEQPLIDDSELDELDWSWTDQLWFICTDDEDNEKVVRACSAQDAANTFVKYLVESVGWPATKAWAEIAYIFKLETNPGMEKVLIWHQDIVPHSFEKPVTSGGKKKP